MLDKLTLAGVFQVLFAGGYIVSEGPCFGVKRYVAMRYSSVHGCNRPVGIVRQKDFRGLNFKLLKAIRAEHDDLGRFFTIYILDWSLYRKFDGFDLEKAAMSEVLPDGK